MRDVIIVGAGGGGPVVAKELAAQGLDVLLLEAGARFSDAEQDWTHLEAAANGGFGALRWGPGDRNVPAWRRELPQHSAVSQVAGVGGTTTHYYGNSPRAMPGVFSDYSGPDADAYDTAHRFPFGYRELIPYYEWVETTLPVETAAMTSKDQAFLDGALAIGLPAQTTKDTLGASCRAQENAILQPRGTAGRTSHPRLVQYPLAKGCTYCGHCLQGCFMPLRAPINLKAKRSTYNSYVPMALTADLWTRGRAVTLLANAFATEVHTEETPSGPRARAVTWRDTVTGELTTEEATVIVLACGTIETPRLWLNSGLPDPNGWVGRGLTDHHFDAVVGTMPFDVKPSEGPASAARADFPGYGGLEPIGGGPASHAGYFFGLSDGGIAGYYDNGLPDGSGADSSGRLVGTALKQALAERERLLTVLVVTDDDVEAHNSVSLSDTQPPDEHGAIPRVVIKHRNRSARTVRNREFLTARAVELLRGAGATDVRRVQWPPLLVHIHSTMRMGASMHDSVLDAGGESYWVQGLFVTDNSALANALGGPNPTLTTQALATRTAERIFERYFGGQRWVGSQSPVCSVHPTVTAAVLRRGL